MLLLNNNYRDWILIPDHSSNYVYTDLSGMISPLNEHWSLEFWILRKDILYRPQEKIASVLQKRDSYINTMLALQAKYDQQYGLESAPFN